MGLLSKNFNPDTPGKWFKLVKFLSELDLKDPYILSCIEQIKMGTLQSYELIENQEQPGIVCWLSKYEYEKQLNDVNNTWRMPTLGIEAWPMED